MAEDLDYRPDALDVGDEVRFAGTWHRVMGRQLGATGIYLRLLAGSTWRTVFYRPGSWVAARPIGRAA
jgi:hypothetical protein